MTSLIKNQIIKHLSKFARNITADQIDVKILSGKGELKNIELNELVLTEVLELPTWLQIRRASCNRVVVRVPWTRLRSSPIQLFIDEIQVEVELTAEPPVSSGTNPLSAYADNSYGFANRVVEGMSLYINTVEIHFDSGAFGGCFMLSRLCVESVSPGWQPISDLHYSRITDSVTNQILMFKQLSWQLLRVEAFAQAENSQRANISAPLRLITSSGRTRITIKKSTIDGSVIGGRIQTILEDILWVATLPQVRSAIAFYSHIMNLVKAAPRKPKAPLLQPLSKASLTNKPSNASNLVSKAFRNFDFDQTSLHLYVGKIDMHLCDDTNASSEFPPDWDIESGALQVTLIRLSIDFYPSNIAGSDRSSWVRYIVPNQCSVWNQKILNAHFVKLCSHLDANAQSRLQRIWPQLHSQNCVLRIYDVVVQCVTDMKSKREGLFNLFMSDRKSKASLPSDQPLVHLEVASFYHPATDNMPLPSNTLHLLIAPFIFLMDQRTVRWVAFVFQDINTVMQSVGATFDVEDMPKSDIRIDFLMPKIVIPLIASGSDDHRFPQRLLISMSTILVTNCGSLHSEDSSFFTSLSSNLLDLVEQVQLSVDIAHFQNFIIQLNNTLFEPEQGEERFWISTSPIWVDTDRGEGTQSIPLLGDVAFHAVVELSSNQINVAIQPQCRVRIFLDHFQLVQITRFLTSLSLFVDQIEADRKFFTGNQIIGDAIPLALVLVVEQAQTNLLLPCTPVHSPYDKSFFSSMPHVASSTDRDSSEVSVERSDPSPALQLKEVASISSTTNSVPNEFGQFPEFPQVVDYDASSNLDETMSIATNVSDEDQRFVVFEAPEDDIFGASDVAIAEDALAVDDRIKADRNHLAELAKHVNVLEALLTSVNVFVSVVNGTTIAEGCSSGLLLKEHFDQARNEVYSSASWKRDELKTEACVSDVTDLPLKFNFFSSADGSIPYLKLQVQGLETCLSDIIVEHLSPFALDEDKVVKPFYLNVKVSKSRLEIKDSSGTPPLRLKINDVVIEQGEEVFSSNK